MPAIACPDCGKEVSTLAPACPHCGRPGPAGTQPVGPAVPLTEETLWSGSPSWKAPVLGYGAAAIIVLVLSPLAGHMIAAGQVEPEQTIRNAWIAATVVALLLALALVVALIRIRTLHYTITNQRVIIERGLLSKSVNEIDLRYVDDSQFYQSVTNRLLGIGNVTLISSDKSSPVMVLRGITDPRGVRETIRAHAYQVSQRQLFTRAT